ncbi:monodechloroaminopyrrolnitrin synthase PrnB family protein [Streptomyces lasiicapitis]|uniref:monodechloroaminopyrrolnitrin synthase PrnB family protein n=1 Tax=Streptomyces lasiicapitis TaxID=1923961 RepID=UPI003661F3C3
MSELDPLRFSEHIDEVPGLNEDADMRGLERLARALLDRVPEAVTDEDTASAALRDLGFVLASIERHGTDHRSLPGAEETLLKLGGLVDEVPRDSVYTYALRNPGNALRTFTGIPQEVLFIEEVRRAGIALRPAVDHLMAALPLPARDPLLLEHLAAATEAFKVFAEALLTVKRNITPEVFSTRMRPYFPPMTVGGTVLYAPGGAQMTPLLVDMAVLRPEPGDPRQKWYAQYLDENLLYLPAAYRAAGDTILTYRPLLPRLLDEATGDTAAPVLAQLRLLMREILHFRLPHLQLARANMRIRPDGSLGSGGYTTDSLDHLVELTTERHQRLSDAFAAAPPLDHATA